MDLSRKKDKVALVGMAESNRYLAPFDDPEWEIWSLNEGYNIKGTVKDKNGNPVRDKDGKKVKEPFLKRWDMLFQMHPDWDYTREGNFNHQNYWSWLQNKPMECRTCHGKGFIGVKVKSGEKVPCPDKNCQNGLYVPERNEDFPIVMLFEDKRVPGTVQYPFVDIMDSFGENRKHVRYFTNSFGYMVALAIFMGYKEIAIYGFEMSSDEEYANQKPNAEFWIGIAIGRGIKLTLTEGTHLLGGREKLYGYEKMPGFTKMHAEIRFREANKKHKQAVEKLQQAIEKRNKYMKSKGFNANSPESMKKLEDISNQIIEKQVEVARWKGATEQTGGILREIQMLPDIDTTEPLTPVFQMQFNRYGDVGRMEPVPEEEDKEEEIDEEAPKRVPVLELQGAKELK